MYRLRYARLCNELYIWSVRFIPTYRIYRLYDYACGKNVLTGLGGVVGLDEITCGAYMLSQQL